MVSWTEVSGGEGRGTWYWEVGVVGGCVVGTERFWRYDVVWVVGGGVGVRGRCKCYGKV